MCMYVNVWDRERTKEVLEEDTKNERDKVKERKKRERENEPCM